MQTCLTCDSTIKKNSKFCSLSCSNRYRESNKAVKFKWCLSCNNSFNAQGKGRSKHKFCSKSCSAKYNNAKYPKRQKIIKKSRQDKDLELLNSWKQGIIDGGTSYGYVRSFIRRYLFEKYKNKCSVCYFEGYNIKTKNSILQIDHIDGNALNNEEKNLRLLCPNCHAMTPTYGALNKNSARSWKSKYK